MTDEPTHWWPAPQATGSINSTIAIPGSKSLTNRHLVLAALAEGTSAIRGPLISRDTVLMVDALTALGVTIDRVDSSVTGDWVVTGGALTTTDTHVVCGLAGTVMRFVPPMAALAAATTRFVADDAATNRPMAPLLHAFDQLGIPTTSVDGKLPIVITGTGEVAGGTITIDASSSSQFVSGLLLSAPRFTDGLTINHVGPPMPSQPHISMTCELLRDVGVSVDDSATDTWTVEPTQLHQTDVEVEPDLSTAAAFLAAATIAGGTVTIPRWPVHTTQAGDMAREILTSMGADIALDRSGLRCRGTGTVTGIATDLRSCGELTPVLAAVAAVADSPSLFTGIGHLRGHETDRLAALSEQLQNLGCGVRATQDSLAITPKPLTGGDFRTYNDHRIAQAGCLLGLVTPGIVIENVGTTAKTLPGFAAMWTDFAAGVAYVRPHPVTDVDVLAE